MMTMRKINFIKICILIFILLFGTICINDIFISPTKGRQTVKLFYQYPKDTLDVLFVGSSHSHHTFNPVVFYENTGLYSYNMAVHRMVFEECYFAIKEVLKYQKPKIIVLEAYSLVNEFDPENNNSSHFLFDNMKNSYNKYLGINYNVTPDRRLEYFFPLYTYHWKWKDASFYKELLDTKSSIPNSNYYGYHASTKILDPFTNQPLENVKTKEKAYLSKDREKLLCNLIEMCNCKDIKLIIASAPYIDTRNIFFAIDNTKILNGIKDITSKHDIDIIDYNAMYDYLNITKRDMRDNGHLNIFGAKKVTDHISDYIKRRYPILFNHKSNKVLDNQYNKKIIKFYQEYNDTKNNLPRYISENDFNELDIVYDLFNNLDKIKILGDVTSTINQDSVLIDSFGKNARFTLPNYKDNTNSIVVKFNINSNTNTTIELLYCGQNEHFSNGKKETVNIYSGENIRYIVLKDNKPIGRIRLDPTNSPGLITIKELKIAK